MDPLSMTASIITLLQITGKIAESISNLRNATKEQQSVAMEAGYLYGVLTSLRFRLSSVQSVQDPWYSQLKALNKVDGPLDHMQKAFEVVRSSLQPRSIKGTISWQWSKNEVRSLVQRMQHLKSLIDFALASDHFTLSQVIRSDVQDLALRTSKVDVKLQKLQDRGESDLRDRLSRWLCLPDPSFNFQAAQQIRHGDTGAWLLSHPKVIDWRKSVSSTIWLHGKAGCGKTILSSTLIKSLGDENFPLAYFYFDFRDGSKQSPSLAMRSILFQLARGNLSDLEQLYIQHDRGNQQPSDGALQALLKKMFTGNQYAFVVLDALDECKDREALLKILQEFQSLNFRMALLSRRERDLEQCLETRVQHSIDLESSLVDRDIAIYIQERVNIDVKLNRWSLEMREKMIDTLCDKANGM